MDKLSLEARIRAEVYSFSGDLGLYANDFKGNVVEVSASETFESASCIKVFILAELFRRVHEKSVSLDTMLPYAKSDYVNGSGVMRALDVGTTLSIKNLASLMIIVSDNIATNILIDLLGVDSVNATCAKLGFADTILHNRIDFKEYERLGTTTPRDYGRFFELVHAKKLISPELSDMALEILGNQQYSTMLTKYLPQYFLDSEDTGDEELFHLATKSGAMDRCRNDGGLVRTPYGSYVIVIFTKGFSDQLYYPDNEAYRYGGRVSRLMFDQFLALKGTFR